LFAIGLFVAVAGGAESVGVWHIIHGSITAAVAVFFSRSRLQVPLGATLRAVMPGTLAAAAAVGIGLIGLHSPVVSGDARVVVALLAAGASVLLFVALAMRQWADRTVRARSVDPTETKQTQDNPQGHSEVS
jgi:hypothetical protein